MREFPEDLREMLNVDKAEEPAKYQKAILAEMMPSGYGPLRPVNLTADSKLPTDRESQPLQPYPARNKAIEKRIVTFDYTGIEEKVFARFNANMTSGGVVSTNWADTIYAWEEEDGMDKKYKDKGPLWEPTEKTPRASAVTKAVSRQQLKMDKKRAPKVAANDWLSTYPRLTEEFGLLEYTLTSRQPSQKSNIRPKASPDVATESTPGGPEAFFNFYDMKPAAKNILNTEESGPAFVKRLGVLYDELWQSAPVGYNVFGNTVVTPSSAAETLGEDVQKADNPAYGKSPLEARVQEFAREQRLRDSSSSPTTTEQMKSKTWAADRFRDPALNPEESGPLLTIEGANYEVAPTTLFRLAADLCARSFGEATMSSDSNYGSYMGQGALLIFSARVSVNDMMLSIKDYFASLDGYTQTTSSYTYIRKDDLLRAKLGRSAPAVAGQRAIVLEEE